MKVYKNKKKHKKGEELKKCYYCKFHMFDTCKHPMKSLDDVCEEFKWHSGMKTW